MRLFNIGGVVINVYSANNIVLGGNDTFISDGAKLSAGEYVVIGSGT